MSVDVQAGDRRIGNRVLTRIPRQLLNFPLSTVYASPLPTPVLPAMSQEPVHGNLSHAMRDNYAEHGVDQVRHLVALFPQHNLIISITKK
jgi:hypothetical protein